MDAEMDAGILQETIQSLKDVDVWEALNRIVIEKCDSLDYGAALEVVGNERLHFAGPVVSSQQ